MVTIILVVYKSKKYQLKNIIKKIGKKYKIIIVDNSYDYDFSKINLSKNTKIIRSKNNGNGAGINIALKKCKTQYAIYSDIDVNFEKNFIHKFIKAALKIKNFSLLVPNHGKASSKEEFIEKYNGEAALMMFNLKKIKSKFFFDEKFFLYFEETDLLTRFKKNNLKSYTVTSLRIKHQRASSIDEKIDKINCIRNWHYMWSMFYYYKKNFGFFSAFYFTYKYLIKDLVMLILYSFLFNKTKFKIRFYRIFGIVCSILGLKSFLRP